VNSKSLKARTRELAELKNISYTAALNLVRSGRVTWTFLDGETVFQEHAPRAEGLAMATALAAGALERPEE
jgi:hypothetical protein